MTPKEKAKQLFDKMYYTDDPICKDIAKELSLIAVDEIMDALEKNGSWNAKYWEEVKQEIEKL